MESAHPKRAPGHLCAAETPLNSPRTSWSKPTNFLKKLKPPARKSSEHAKKNSLRLLRIRRRANWTELRIRRAQLVEDNVTLPIQRLRDAISELIKLSEDKDIGQELLECNRRLAELRDEVKLFLEQGAEDHVYWVERTGKAQKNLSLNAAPVDVADYLRPPAV